jgi:hypothetical protein
MDSLGMTGGQLFTYLCDHDLLAIVFMTGVFGVVGGVVALFAYLGKNG